MRFARIIAAAVVLLVVATVVAYAGVPELRRYTDSSGTRSVSAPVGWTATWDADGVAIADEDDGDATLEFRRVRAPRGLNDDGLVALVDKDLTNPLIAGERAPDGSVRYCAVGTAPDGSRRSVCAQAHLDGGGKGWILIGRMTAPAVRYRGMDGTTLLRTSMDSASGFTD